MIGVSALVVTIRNRKKAAIDELAGVFSYTAELLAAGDEVREAIFNCYEGLCKILMSRGFLRRDFETVREFEMAIRSALPISEQALLSLDRIFEEARYSSHVLGNQHRESAQMALNSVLQEIDQLEEVPLRSKGKIIDD
jgi:nitrate reductase beta subunit